MNQEQQMTIRTKNWTTFQTLLKKLHKDKTRELEISVSPVEQYNIGQERTYINNILKKYSTYLRRDDIATDLGKSFLRDLGEDVASAKAALTPAETALSNALMLKDFAKSGTRLQKDKADYAYDNALLEKQKAKAKYDIVNKIYGAFNHFRRN